MTAFARQLLVALDALPVLRAPGRLLYRATVRWVSALCRSFPDVRAVYATGSMAGRDIVPGLSDIDLVLVIRDLPADREFRLIRQIERRLRFAMPPPGEEKSGTHLMIYASAEWESVGGILLGKRAGRAAVLLDRRETRKQDPVDRRVHTLHHLLKAGWRLEDMQRRLGEMPAGRLEALLARRMADRLLGALEDACVESGVSQQARAELGARTADVRRELDRRDAVPGESILPRVLPGVLACFDLAVRLAWPTAVAGDPPDPWSAAAAPDACAHAGSSEELARALQARVGERLAGVSVWAARVGTADFVVCEPLTEAVGRVLVDERVVRPGRPMHILSPRMLSALYLADAFGPRAFVRLGDLRRCVAAGRRDPERSLLEAYAMFPRVRALGRLDDPAVLEVYRNRIARLVGDFQGTVPAETLPAAAADAVPEGGSLREVRHCELRNLAHALQDAVSRHLSPAAGRTT